MSRNENFIKKGTTILTAKPFAYILSSKCRTNRCDYCLKESGKIFRCSACRYVYYCNRACQKNSWPVHSKECQNLNRISPKVIPDVARLMARIIVKLNQGGGEEVGYYSRTGYRKFKDLMSHYSDIKKDEKKMEHFMCLCGVLFSFLTDTPMPNSAELIGIYGRICINSFNIFDSNNSVGVAIYLGPSVIDHSCEPNAVATFEGTTIIIRTVEDIPCLDWSQIRISYIDTLKTTKERRTELQNTYYFWCDCKRCEEPEPLAEAAACPNKLCTYPCHPDTDVCESCNTKFPEKFRETFDEVSDFTAHHLQNMKDIAYLDVSKMCLKRQEGVLHSLNVQHVQTLQAAFDSTVSLQHWEKAESYAKRLIDGYLMYYGEIRPVTGILYLMIAKIQLLLEKPRQALQMIKKANAILAITHGEQHTLVQENLKPLLECE